MIDYTTFRAESDADVLIIEVTGKLDADTSEYLMDCVQGEIEDGARCIVLDCSRLEYISSLGLGTLVRASLRVRKEDGAVVLSGVEGMVAEVVRLAQLGRMLHMYGSVDEAVASFKK